MRGLVVIVAFLAACGDNIEVFEEQPSIEVGHYAAVQANELDMLFVVDNTLALGLQHDLANQISVLFDALAGTSIHVGVTTTDLGTTTSRDRAAPLPAFGSCSGVGDDGVLNIASDGDDLVTDVQSALQVGASGCDFQQPLGAMARALDNPANAGFVRDDANLLVVLINSDDDCSARDAAMFEPTTNATLGPRGTFRCTRFGIECDEPIRAPGEKTNCHSNETSRLVEHVRTYVERLRSAKPDPTRLATYVMAGPTSSVVITAFGGYYELAPTCSYPNGRFTDHSLPGIRLRELTSAFGANGGYGELCQSNFVGQLAEIAGLAKAMNGVLCLDTSKLVDSSSEAGLQPSCSVSVESPSGTRTLHECTADVGDCFQVVRDVSACPLTADSLRLDVHVANPGPDEHVRASCITPS